MRTTPRRPEHQVLRRAFSTQTPRKIRDPLRQNSCPTETANPRSFFESVLTRTESQAYDFAALGKHEGNSGLEDERPAAYLCFGTLHAPHCATQVLCIWLRNSHDCFQTKSPTTSGFLTSTPRKIRDPDPRNPRPNHAKSRPECKIQNHLASTPSAV